MKRIFLLVPFFFFVLTLHAQQSNFLPEQGPEKNSFLITSDFFVASNSITYELAKTYFLKGFITNVMKDRVSKHLEDRNRLGGEFTTEMYFRHKSDSMFGSKNWSWFTGIKNIDHVNAVYSRDLFELYFRGNKNYAGKKADFSGFNYLLLKYQQVQFGLSKLFMNDSVTCEFGGAIGFNAGQQLQRIQSEKSDLFTEETGEYLDVNANVELHTSDSLHKDFGSFNGFGMSTDLFFRETFNKKLFFFIRISNLGFILWNSRSAEIKADTSFRFEGIEVNDLFSFADSVKSTIAVDSSFVQPFLTNRKYHTYTLFLPAKIELSYKQLVGHEHMRAGLGMIYFLHADYLPQLHMDFDYSWNKNMFTINLTFGGYAPFGAGIFYEHHFNHGYMLKCGSNSINSWFDINNSRFQHVSAAISRNF